MDSHRVVFGNRIYYFKTLTSWEIKMHKDSRYYLSYSKAVYIYNNISHGIAESKISSILIIYLIINPATLR